MLERLIRPKVNSKHSCRDLLQKLSLPFVTWPQLRVSVSVAFVCLVQLLFVGRVVLGVGVGAGTMIGPVYLAEMAPANLRGSLNVIFQLFVSHFRA